MKRPPDLSPEINIEFVEANGLAFEVYTCGKGDRLALCLHGFPEHAYSWRHQLTALAECGFRVWAPNLRGYGNTERPNGTINYTLDNLMADVAGLIDASNTKSTVLIAHDWGAVIAWEFAIRQLRDLDRLIILNLPHPAIYTEHAKHWRQGLRSWYVTFFQIPWLPDFLLRINRAWAVGASIRLIAVDRSKFTNRVIDIYRANASSPGATTAMINYYRGAVQRPGGAPGLSRDPRSKILTPTLMIWGEEDSALGIEMTKGTERYVDDFTLRTLPGVSHWVQQEAPEMVNAMMKAWFEGGDVPQAKELSARFQQEN